MSIFAPVFKKYIIGFATWIVKDKALCALLAHSLLPRCYQTTK